jgi:hypothetical protein
MEYTHAISVKVTSLGITHLVIKKNSSFPWFLKDAAAALNGLVRFICYLFTIPTEGEIFLFSKVFRRVATGVILRS